MNIQKISFIISFLCFIIFFSCGKEPKKEVKTNEPKSEKNVLSGVIINENLGISYQVPLNWELMSAELSKHLIARLDGDNFEENFIVYQPEAYYFNSGISSLLRIGSVIKSAKNTDKLTINSYIQYYQKFNANKNFRIEKIQTNTLVITQMIIKKSNLISFKNILMNKQNKIIQFDFSLKEEDYENEKEAINSSLASIKIL